MIILKAAPFPKFAAGVPPAAAIASSLLAPAVACAAPGDLDPAFGDVGRAGPFHSLLGGARSLELLPNGRVVIAGGVTYRVCEDGDPPCYYEAHDYEAFNFVRRLDDSGSIDPRFYAELLDQIEVFGIVRQADGKIVAVGRSVDLDVGNSEVAVFRLRDDGRLDTSFGDNGIVDIGRNGAGYAVHLDASGRIVVAGSVDNTLTVFRLLPDGSLDQQFGNAGFFDSNLGRPNAWTDLVPTSSGGYRITERVGGDCRIVALSAGGAIDTSFGESGRAMVETTPGEQVVCRAILSQADGKILVAGTSGNRGFALRLLETGELDTTFVADPVILSAMEFVTAMGLREDGSVLVAGAGARGASIAQLQANGELDPLFGNAGITWIDLTSETGLYQSIHEIAVDADGRVLAAGEDGWTDSPFAIRLLGMDGGDSPGVLGFGDRAVSASELEGQTTVRVRRTGGRAGRVSVRFRTAEYQYGGATVGEDYEAVTGRLTWEDGDATDQQVVIPIHQDAGRVEILERFSVELHDTEGGAGLGAFGATVNIEADGAPFGQFELWVPSRSVTETETVSALVRRNFFARGEVSVTVRPIAGSATSGEDFVDDPVTLTWADRDSEAKWVEFNLVDDAIAEPLESYSLKLVNPTGGAIIGPDASATILIAASDGFQPPPDPDPDPVPDSRGGGGTTGLLSLILLGLAQVVRSGRRASKLTA